MFISSHSPHSGTPPCTPPVILVARSVVGTPPREQQVLVISTKAHPVPRSPPDFSGPWHFRAQPRCSYLWRECITPTPECEHRRPPLAVKVNRKNCGRPQLTFENQLRADSGPGVAQCSYQSTDRQVIADTGAVSDHAPECWEVIFDKLRGRQLDPEAEPLSVNSRLVEGRCASRAYQSSDRYLIAILCPITVWNVRRQSQLQTLS